MDCCGHGHVVAFQPWMWRTLLASIGTMLAGEAGPRGLTEAARTAETTATELAVLRNSISVNVHSHGGKAEIISKVTSEQRSRRRDARGIAGGRLFGRRAGLARTRPQC